MTRNLIARRRKLAEGVGKVETSLYALLELGLGVRLRRFQVDGYLRKSGTLSHVELMDTDPQTPERQLFYVNSWVVVSVSELFSLGGCCLVLLCGWISDNSTLLTTIQTAFLPGMLQSVAVDLDQPHTKWLFLGKPRVDSASMSTGFVI